MLVSEFMLQQTQVGTAIPYFHRWMARWPNLTALAAADEAEALKLWEGLGYYSRCRNLLRAARSLAAAGCKEPPASVEMLRACPGIGDYTAGAVASLGHGVPVPAVDGNAERVLSRLLGIAEPAGSAPLRRAATLAAAEMLEAVNPREFNQALMDLGALVCRPRAVDCAACPWGCCCLAHQEGREMEFPLPRRRPSVSQDAAWGLLALRGTGMLLRRRPDAGLWAGMWEIPWFPRTGDFWRDLKAWRASGEGLKLELRRDSLEEAGAVNFAYTTHRVRAWVMACQAEEGDPGEGWRFAAPEELEALTLPAPSRKFLGLTFRITNPDRRR